MSLSKYFKHSNSFQPEKIFKPQTGESPGFHTSVNKSPPDSFRAEKQVTKTETPVLSSPPSENAAHPPPLPDALPAQIPDPDQYISISEVEERVKKAYADGIQRGIEKAEEDYGSAMKSFVTSCRQLDTVRETIISNSRSELQEFSLAIAERIIRSSLRDNNSTIIATIEEALRRAVKSEEFYIYIHPDDYDTVAGKSDEIITGLSGLSNIIIKKDSTVERGGAKIESDNCTIDATIAGQFDVILREMKKKLEP